MVALGVAYAKRKTTMLDRASLLKEVFAFQILIDHVDIDEV